MTDYCRSIAAGLVPFARYFKATHSSFLVASFAAALGGRGKKTWPRRCGASGKKRPTAYGAWGARAASS